MIYKQRYELSQSLNGNTIVHIARNSAGTVVFREESANQLKKTIDNYLKELQNEAEMIAKKAAEKLAQKNKNKTEPKKAAPARLTRTQDGKFISKSTLEKAEPPRKKSFWG